MIYYFLKRMKVYSISASLLFGCTGGTNQALRQAPDLIVDRKLDGLVIRVSAFEVDNEFERPVGGAQEGAAYAANKCAPNWKGVGAVDPISFLVAAGVMIVVSGVVSAACAADGAARARSLDEVQSATQTIVQVLDAQRSGVDLENALIAALRTLPRREQPRKIISSRSSHYSDQEDFAVLEIKMSRVRLITKRALDPYIAIEFVVLTQLFYYNSNFNSPPQTFRYIGKAIKYFDLAKNDGKKMKEEIVLYNKYIAQSIVKEIF